MASETDGTEVDTDSTEIEEIENGSIRDQCAAVHDAISCIGFAALDDCALGHCGSAVDTNLNCSEIKEVDNDLSVDSSLAVNNAITNTEIQEIEEIEEIGNDSIVDRDMLVSAEVDTLSSGECLPFARMAEMMLNRPALQYEILQALEQEPELRGLIDTPSLRQDLARRAAICPPDAEQEGPNNFIHGQMDQIGQRLEMAGEGVANAGQRLGNFLRRVGRKLRGVDDAVEQEHLSLCTGAAVVAIVAVTGVRLARALLRQ
ncbi:unnamed protein product [Ostreobium quekettii]|uniref:Uncharacterized protein n=1 Tax=Ostreobium quekettii TaxID=121088 RepID=A0A8S1JDF7_9CHLO|nr:unnamed protein product [Ostreobium quekettii]